jgi:signal transduction histidine kinase/HAMP domain-containing protein/CheY-like chemotaxis protein
LVTDTVHSGPRLDKSGLEQLLAGLTAVRGGDFSTRLAQTGDPLMDEIATVFNGMADQLDLFTSEVTRVAREVGTEGKLGGQAYVPGVSGTWKDLTESVNAMAGNLTGQVRNIAQVATAVAKGDLSQKIDVDARGEILELKSTLNTMVDQLSSFADEVTRVAREVGTDGLLGGQADVKGVSGTWKDLTESVNVMAANLTDQVRSIAEVTTAVAKGDLSQKIRVDARGEIMELKETINTMVDQLSAFADEVTRVAREVGTEGKLGGQAVVRGVSGTWKDLTDNVNVMASNLTGQVRSIAQVATAVERGDLSQKIDVDAMGEVAALAGTINRMVGTLSAFADEVTRVAREVGTEGRLGGQADVKGVSGTWKDLTDNVNSMAQNLTGQVRNIAQVTTAVANGDLSKKIDVDARGEILELKTTINTMVDQLSSFAAEVTRVAREVGSEGRLGGQAEVEGVSGTWKRLTENVNELAGNLTRQVRAIAEVTSAVASGDLTRSISVEAQGEVAELKDNINAMVQSLRETIRANQQQDWLKTNLAQIAGMMQGHRDLAVVAELIMDELAPLVDAQHGTFFLAEPADGDTQLRLIAGYGLRADKTAPIQYRLGQSMIGQVARSKRSIIVGNLPEGYVKISSGLGEAPPANLAVLPILFEDQVLGVIELASFTSFSPVQTDFLELLTETLGVNFNTIIANARTDTLLEESQRLTTELQARSEELQDQQVELQRSNADLEDKAALLATQNRDIETKNAEIEQARQEIEERARQLALASKYKSQFLANMSHELRTPLNSLLILARLLAQNPGRNLSAKQVEYANVIHSAGSDLLQLINDILDLSKVEAGRMDIHVERFGLGVLLEDVQATFQPLTAEKGLEFAVEADAEAPPELFTDRQRLRQVLGNLLANAVKFTERGHVILRVGRDTRTPVTPQTHDGGEVLAFSVTDTGIGIAPENISTIFGAFQQGDGTLSRRYGGTGLGLSIAREVGALLGGEIVAESELSHGSTFTLYLPCELPGVTADGMDWNAAAAPASEGVAISVNGGAHADATEALRLQPTLPDDTATAGRRLLVLEGSRGGLLTLLAYSAVSDLTGIPGPVHVGTAVSPEQGIEALAAAPHQCVVLDLGLEDASAFAFLEQLAEEPKLRDVPVLAHTRDTIDSAQARLARLRFGSQTLELLPSLDELRERITLHLSAAQPGHVPALISEPEAGLRGAEDDRGSGSGSRPSPEAEGHEALRGKRVLVIDDDPRNVFAITSTLELHGMTVAQATNGRKGIEALLTAEDTDLVLMDVMMPELDGYATMNKIRQMPAFATLPIIAVTARAMPGDKEKSIAAGASDYVTKPVDTDELLACMERWLACRLRPARTDPPVAARRVLLAPLPPAGPGGERQAGRGRGRSRCRGGQPMMGHEHLGAARVRLVGELTVRTVVVTAGLVDRLPEVGWPVVTFPTAGLLRVVAGPGQVPVEQGGHHPVSQDRRGRGARSGDGNRLGHASSYDYAATVPTMPRRCAFARRRQPHAACAAGRVACPPTWCRPRCRTPGRGPARTPGIPAGLRSPHR